MSKLTYEELVDIMCNSLKDGRLFPQFFQNKIRLLDINEGSMARLFIDVFALLIENELNSKVCETCKNFEQVPGFKRKTCKYIIEAHEGFSCDYWENKL